MANQIHPTCIIEGDVKLGNDNVIHPYSVLQGPLEIGDNNIIGPHVVIGSPGEDSKNPRYDSSNKKIRIGSHNIIREFSAIEKPCFGEYTIVGSHIFIMRNSQVCHDVLIEDHVVVALSVSFSGLTRVLCGANIGLGVNIHQNSVIGQYAMVAMGAVITKNLKPFCKFIPNKPLKVNHYALSKFKLEAYTAEIEGYVLDNEPPHSPEIQRIVARYQVLHLASKRTQYG